jgi:glutathione reductase (NADPH)
MTNMYDLIVIGTGVAATKIAETCRQAGWHVAIVDRRPYGGTCMLRGCDPKKLLWGVAQTVDQARRFAHDGFAGKASHCPGRR